MISRRELEIILSKVKGFTRPERRLEQYVSDARSAAMIVHEAFIRGDIEDRVVADLGAGTGILGIGAAVTGARKVYMVEVDPRVIEVLEENVREVVEDESCVHILKCDVSEFNVKVDTVIMNPPFGKFIPEGDRKFLQKALDVASAVYTFMNFKSEPFVRAVASEKGFKVEVSRTWEIEMKRFFAHHRKEKFLQKVDFYILRKSGASGI